MELSMTVLESSRSRIPKVCSITCPRVTWQALTLNIVWRTSTPEPTYDGIIWTYTKDVTRYIPLFSKPGTFILELDNIVSSVDNGQYASTRVIISSQTMSR